MAIDEGRPLPARVAWFREWRQRGGKLWLSIGRCTGAYVLRFPDHADFTITTNPNLIVIRPADVPQETLRHLLIDQVLPLALSLQGRLILHASAVHLPGIGAIGFVGESGRGKSTLAAALAARGARVISDDSLAIDFKSGAPVAIPAYPGLRLWPGAAANPLLRASGDTRVAHYSRKRRVSPRALLFHRRRSPLRCVFLLSARSSAGAPVSIRGCRARAGLIGMQRCTYLLDPDDRQILAGAFTALATLATTVPVLRLRLRHGHRWLPEAADLIRAYAAGVLTS